jgi:hypothetical protein
MKLNRIAARNFKGRSFDHQLSPVVVVAGDNFSGKTAILDAVRVGLVGYLPRLGKQPGSTWKLAGDGADMEVSLETDSTTLSHVWRPSKTGASYEGSIPWQTPPVLLDAREYFTQTSAQRIDTVFRLSDPARLGYTDGKLLERLAGLEVLPMKVARPVIDRLTEELGQSMAGRNGTTVQEWLGKHIERVKSQLKEAQAQAKFVSAQATATKPKPRVGGAPKDVSRELAAAQADRDNLAGKAHAIKSAMERSVEAQFRKQQITEALRALPSDFSGIERMEAELAALAGAVELETARDRVQTARAKLEAAKAAIEAAQAALARTENPDSMTCCPTCKSSQPGWRQHLDAAYAARTAEVRQLLGEARNSAHLWSEELAAAKTAFDQASKDDDARQGRRRDLQSSIQRLRTDQRSREKYEAELAGLTAGTAPEATDLPSLEAAAAEATTRILSLQAAQAEFTAYQADRARRDEFEEQSIGKTTEVEVLKAAVKELVAVQSELVDVAFNELLATAARFTDGILRSPLVYHDGELGRLEGERFVSWETFSGTEEALAFAGLSVALAVQAPVKVVLIDELGRLTAANKEKVLSRMVALTAAGAIDCFIGADVTPANVPGVANIIV